MSTTTATVPSFDSLRGVLSMLTTTPSDTTSQVLGLLNEHIDAFWFEVADSLSTLQHLATQSSLAALVLSKLHFYLADYPAAVKYALISGDLFNAQPDKSEYKQTLIAKIIDEYLVLRKSHEAFDKPLTTEFGMALESMFSLLVQKSIYSGDVENAVAIALEARRIDLVLDIIKTASTPLLSFINYMLELISCKDCADFSASVLREVATRELAMPQPNVELVAKCYLTDQHLSLLSSFIEKLSQQDRTRAAQLLLDSFKNESSSHQDNLPFDEQLYRELRLQFLSNRNHADMMVLDRTKTFLQPASSLHHQALSFANGFTHCGTTCDSLIRDDMTWFSQASNWAKFSAVASLGVIHQGHSDGIKVLESFLPKDGITSSEYAEGGALYALGLLSPMSDNGKDEKKMQSKATSLLLKHLGSASEVVQHGACLGLGLSALGKGHGEEIEALKIVLYSDNAVAGEAAALAIGLLYYGGKRDDETLSEILQYSKETSHEKISRAIALAVALAHAETCDAFSSNQVQEMLNDSNDAIQRYGGIWAIALSYARTGDIQALSVLLKTAVTDSSDDVRRTAVTGLGFVMCDKHKEQLPEMLRHLLLSYNPHMRYGSAMALAIAFAGTGRTDIINLLKPLSRDLIDFVRQAALIAMSMVLQQAPEKATKELRRALETSIQTKHEDALVKFGAVISQGFLDAGGRNGVFTLRKGIVDKKPIAGMALFLQFWYWYPLSLMASLSLAPTAFIAVEFHADSSYRLPLIEGRMDCVPSLTAFPAPLKATESIATTKVLASAVLSTSKRRGKNMMETEPVEPETPTPEPQQATESEMPVEEPENHSLANFERVPLWLADKFSCDLLKRPFDPFGINVVDCPADTLNVSLADHQAKIVSPLNLGSNDNTSTKKGGKSSIKPPKPFKLKTQGDGQKE